MGGIGSGRWFGEPDDSTDRKALTKELPAFHIGDLKRAGVLEEGASGWLPPWRGSGADPGFIAFECRAQRLHLRFDASGPDTQTEQVIQILHTPCHFGGPRPWFGCPEKSCGRRVGVLYAKDYRLRCRTCWGLAYSSQRRTKLQRLKDKATRLRAEFGRWSDVSDEFPPPPKGMHVRTYYTLCDEIGQIEAHIVKLEERERLQMMSRILGYQCAEELSLEEHWEHVRRR